MDRKNSFIHDNFQTRIQKNTLWRKRTKANKKKRNKSNNTGKMRRLERGCRGIYNFNPIIWHSMKELQWNWYSFIVFQVRNASGFFVLYYATYIPSIHPPRPSIKVFFPFILINDLNILVECRKKKWKEQEKSIVCAVIEWTEKQTCSNYNSPPDKKIITEQRDLYFWIYSMCVGFVFICTVCQPPPPPNNGLFAQNVFICDLYTISLFYILSGFTLIPKAMPFLESSFTKIRYDNRQIYWNWLYIGLK